MQSRVLTDEDVSRIHEATLKVLGRTGSEFEMTTDNQYFLRTCK